VGLPDQAYGDINKSAQLRYPRVRQAYAEKEVACRELFEARGIAYPPAAVFIRIFKEERCLELWAASAPDQAYIRIKSYEICAVSGRPGPKRKQGDCQIPEGFYTIDRFNPASRFFLSLGINYPNVSDRKLGDKQRPGGDIFIHGDCVTIGCVPITDDQVKELYVIVLDTVTGGSGDVPVHIFPMKMAGRPFEKLLHHFRHNPEILTFWENVSQGYKIFEEMALPPHVSVNSEGRYCFN
jgi:murein L,D-transpeptidase YafK